MLDINLIRENPEIVKENLRKRGLNVSVVDEVLKLLKERGVKRQKLDTERAEKNLISKEVSKKKTDELLARGGVIKAEIQTLEADLKDIEESLRKVLLDIPNLLVDGVPVGDESHNQVLNKVGEPTKFDFQPKDHLVLGELLNIIDIPRAVKVSGSRFAYLKNEGVLLEFALIQLVFQKLINEGFVPLLPPMLIKKEITENLGYWHGGGNENYYFVRDYEKMEGGKERELDLYLVGTGEHAGVPMHSGEILNEKDLPKKYVIFSSCFRREAGSYGKDTKGILRVHQFDKVEMIAYVKPEDDEKERRKLLSLAEDLMQSLGIPYQTVKLASGDLGFPSAETVDIEAWIPSQNKYRETHSISTTTDFQARRLDIKYQKGDKKEFVHILNGTAFAIGRTIIAILENNQQEDGSVLIPKVLRDFIGKDKIIV